LLKLHENLIPRSPPSSVACIGSPRHPYFDDQV
jgi:hypothetical protein